MIHPSHTMATSLRTPSSHDYMVEKLEKEAGSAAERVAEEGFKTWATITIVYVGVQKDLHRLVFSIFDSEGKFTFLLFLFLVSLSLFSGLCLFLSLMQLFLPCRQGR